MIISIGGLAGTGTTTVSKMLAEEFNFRHIYAGDVFREEAKKRNMTLQEFGKLAEENPEIDRNLDNIVSEKAGDGNAVVEGRISSFILKRDGHRPIKVWFECDDEVRFQRVAGRENISMEKAKSDCISREDSERKRYLEIYGYDYTDLSDYDIIIDTSYVTPLEIMISLKESILNIISEEEDNE